MFGFFIERFIFTWVIALPIMLVGIIVVRDPSIEQHPNIAQAAVSVSATYPSANAQTTKNSAITLGVFFIPMFCGIRNLLRHKLYLQKSPFMGES